MFLVGHLPRLAHTAAATMAETAIAYCDSTLSVHHGAHHHGTTRAGEHAPDPDGLTRPDGTLVTVEDLLTRPGMLLLVRGSAGLGAADDLRDTLGDLGTVVRIENNPAAASADDVIDPDDVLAHAYGWGADRDGTALIRPDGYLGLVADCAESAILRTYLADTLRLTHPATATSPSAAQIRSSGGYPAISARFSASTTSTPGRRENAAIEMWAAFTHHGR